MSSLSPNRRGSVISNCTNDSDIASDCKTPISGQPKKLRKQINNDEFKQNYFELNLSNTSGVQVLAFQPGSDSTPKKRKRSSSTAARRKSVSSVAAEDSNNEDSPQVQTKLNKKRKQSIAANSVDTVNTPSEELFSEEGNSLQAIDQSLLNSLSSCDFDSLFKEDERKKDHQLCDNLFLPKSAFKDLKKGRNLACSTTNIQTTSTCSYSLKNSPETPTTSRNRSISNSHPIILNQTNSNTIRKRSNSCVSVGQLSNSQPLTTTSCAPIINNNTCTVSPPERLMAKEMKLNAYLSLVREVENCGNSQNSPMTLSSQSGSTPSHHQDNIISSVSTAPSNAHFQRFDSNNSYYYDGNHMMPWEVMELPGTIQEQQSHHFNNQPLLSDLVCKQLVNSVFQENQRRAVQSAGLDPSLFEALFNNIQDTIATTDSHQTVNNQIASPTLLPFLSSETLQAMEPSQIQDLIDYLERLQSSKKVSPPQRSTFEDNSASHQSSSESYLMAQDEYHSNDEFMF